MGNQCCTNNNAEADGRNEEISAASPLPPRTRRSSSLAVTFEDDPSIISTHFLGSHRDGLASLPPPPPPRASASRGRDFGFALAPPPPSFEALPSRQRWFERARERQAQSTQDRQQQQRAADETETSESTSSPSSTRTSPVVAGDLSPELHHPLGHHWRNAPIARRHSGVLAPIADMLQASAGSGGQRGGGGGPPMDPTLIALQSLAARLRAQQDDGDRFHSVGRRDEDEIVRGLEAFVRMLVAGGTPDGSGSAAGAPHAAGDDGRRLPRRPRFVLQRGGGTGVMRRGEIDFYTFTQVLSGAPQQRSDDANAISEPQAEAPAANSCGFPPQDSNSATVTVGHLVPPHSPSSYVDCCICMMEYTTGDVLRVLPCLHRFHKDCADKWLCDSKSACPICRECPKQLTERNQRMHGDASSHENEEEDEGGNIDNEYPQRSH